MSISITKSSTGANGTTGSSVLGLGSKDSWLIYGDNGTIGMTNKTIGVSSISMGIRQASVSIRIPGIGKGQAMSTKVSCLGSSNLSCVGGDHGTVGVSYQLGSGQSLRKIKIFNNKCYCIKKMVSNKNHHYRQRSL